MPFENELSKILNATQHIQTALTELEQHTDNLDQITEETLNNGWPNNWGDTIITMKYRLEQITLRYNDIGNAVNELKTQIGAME